MGIVVVGSASVVPDIDASDVDPWAVTLHIGIADTTRGCLCVLCACGHTFASVRDGAGARWDTFRCALQRRFDRGRQIEARRPVMPTGCVIA
jgi:hypothetical protein